MKKYKCKGCGYIFEGLQSQCPRCGAVLAYTEKQKDGSVQRFKVLSPVQEEYDGSFGLGFILGFLFSLIGMIIALCLPGSKTKTGGPVGFIVQAFIGGIIYLIIYLVGQK